MATKRKQPPKIGKIELTDHEREVIAAGVDSEFFKILVKKIVPQREVQVALTLLHAGQDDKDLFFYKGMLHVLNWFPGFIAGEAEKVDDAVYENDEEGDGRNSAEDDNTV